MSSGEGSSGAVPASCAPEYDRVDVMRLRIRRLQSTFLRSRRYEVECTALDDPGLSWRRVTGTPVTVIDPYLGVGDAWSLIHAADTAWAGGVGEWVEWPKGVDSR
jgi:hypothetical protein